MALSFVQEPVETANKVPVITNWTPLIGYMLYQSSSIVTFFYYQLVFEIRLTDSSGTLLGKIKQRKNGYGGDIIGNQARAFFDLRDIVNTQLVDTVFDQNDDGQPFRTIHKLGSNRPSLVFSINGDRNIAKFQVSTIYVKGYQQYSDAANEMPTERVTGYVSDTLHYISASLPLMTARDSDPDYIQGANFQVYQGKGSSDKFLSDLETSAGEYNLSGYINYIQDTDYHTLAFLNDTTLFASDIDYIFIKYYDNTNSIIGSAQALLNSSTAGGYTPSGEGVTDPTSSQAQSVNTSARPSNFPDWVYYTVQGTASAADVYALRTKAYYFIKQDSSCKGYKVRRLAWRNSLGCYDYFNFKMKSTQTVEVNRNNYNTMLGTFTGSKWRYNNTQRGKTTRETTAVLKETLNTNWITEQDANLLEKLLVSTHIDIVENADTEFTEGVLITDSSFIRKTKANDKLIQYTINIEYANPINTNS